jgi:hypothetical protein
MSVSRSDIERYRANRRDEIDSAGRVPRHGGSESDA